MNTQNRVAVDAYLHALNDMPGTRPGYFARVADRMAGAAFDGWDEADVKPPRPDTMMDIEAAMFVGLCEANGVDWRNLRAAA